MKTFLKKLGFKSLRQLRLIYFSEIAGENYAEK